MKAVLLIDKEQTYQILSEYYHHSGTLQHMALREALDRVPVVDAVPVIRCKDCKYCDSGIDEDDKPFLKCLSGRSYGGTNADDYCSWAERKER